jgi:hypothetical protein
VKTVRVLTAVLCVCAAIPAHAQDAKPAPVPLKVQIVLSRFEGEKKVASMPYTLLVNAADKDNRVTLRMGVSVPMNGIKEVVYRDVGTNMDCTATVSEPGRFRISLSVNNTSVFDSTDKQLQASVPRADSSAQVLRSFTSSFVLNLKDGETGQSISATDPVTGEVMKIDVTLHVLK